MKTAIISALVMVGAGALSCTPKNNTGANGGTSNSGLASVTINQPKIKEAMKPSMSEADKTKLYDSLVYQISIKSQKTADDKDDCDAGVVPTSFDSDILALDKGASDTVKVKKGCNYIVSMKYGVKSDDGKSIKTVMIQSADATDPGKLSKDELQKPKPTAIINLYVTAEGQPFWNISVIPTPPSDSDVSVLPSLAVKYVMKADKVSAVIGGTPSKFTGSTTLTPVNASAKEMSCGVMMSVEASETTATPSTMVTLLIADDMNKSIVTFPANSVAPIVVDGLVAKSPSGALSVVRSQTVFAVCASDAAAALAKLKTCLNIGQAGTSACETDSAIVK